MTRLTRETTGINYIPRFVRMPSDMEYGSIVTHEHYNEILNLNGSQGDYNTEILRLLLTVSNPEQVPHVKYLDEVIYTLQDDMQIALDNSANALETATQASNDVLDILNGVKLAGKAKEALKITGIDEAGAYKYYGTNGASTPGFYTLPPFISADDMGQGQGPNIDGIYYVPRTNSVDETMLTEAVRVKLNRVGITDYDDLTGRPSINGITLTGNKTLTQLGIQPAGSYLTSVPSEYITDSELATALSPYATSSSISNTYATKNALNVVSQVVTDNAAYAEGRYARICVGSFTGTPKTGDMLVTL